MFLTEMEVKNLIKFSSQYLPNNDALSPFHFQMALQILTILVKDKEHHFR